MPNQIFFKALKAGRKAPHNDYQWPKPGVWTPKTEPVVCQSGWHVANLVGLSKFIDYCGATELWLCEVRGKKTVWSEGKAAFEQARLVRKLPLSIPRLHKMTRKYRKQITNFSLGSYNDVSISLPYYDGERFKNKDFARLIKFFHAIYTGRGRGYVIIGQLSTKARKELRTMALNFFRELANMWSIELGIPSGNERVKI